MTEFQAIILGLIQGVTEFLPISSSAHLVIVPKIFGWQQQSLTFDIVAHAGSLLAIIYYYRNKIKSLIKSIFSKIDLRDKRERQGQNDDDKRLLLNIVLATIPTVAIYLIVRRYLENTFESLDVIKYSLLIGGIFLILADIYNKKLSKYIEIKPVTALLVGVGQGISLIRGVSRSGAMLTIGLFSKSRREKMVEFILLASIPIILGGLVLESFQYTNQPTNESVTVLVLGFLTSALSGYLAIMLLNKFINRNILVYSGIYRIFVALLIFWL